MSDDNPPLEKISEYFREKANQFYTRGPEGETYIAAPTNGNDDPNNLGHFWERIIAPSPFSMRDPKNPNDKRTNQLQTLTRDELAAVESILGDQGFYNFTHFSEGSSAQCFRSGNVALRIGPAPMEDVPKEEELELVREFCPLVLQPQLSLITEQSRVLFEVLPFQLNIRNGRIPEAFSNVIEGLFENTCFRPFDDDKDLSLMPDGTPMYLDPDAVYLRNRLVEPTQADFNTIRENALRLNWPEELLWVTPEGEFKQRQFYPMKTTKVPDFIVR